MKKDIDILNRRFGDALGRPNGNDSRFAWKYAPELYFYWRGDNQVEYRRRCWAEVLGKRWVLCEWRPPLMTIQGVTFEVTRDQWFQIHKGQVPYPQKGEYVPYMETALAPEAIPTAEGTAFYISSVRSQMEAAEQFHKAEFAGRTPVSVEESERAAQAVVDDHAKQFYDSVADWEPLSWKLGNPQPPNSQDGPVAFQVGGSRDEKQAA